MRAQKYNFFFYADTLIKKNRLNQRIVRRSVKDFAIFAKLLTKTLNIMQLLTIGWPEILLIALIVLLLFGAKKIPELMKGLGKGVKSFKDGMNGAEEPEDKKKDVE